MVLFIAIELEDRLKDHIHDYVQKTLRPACREGRWVSRDNYHITLKYIGDVKAQQIGMLLGLLNDAAMLSKSFVLRTGSTGVFGKHGERKARVLWIDVSGDKGALDGLRGYIETGTVKMGFKAESRFSPHITVARDVSLTVEPAALDGMEPVRIEVNSISLMESRVEKGKRVYLPLSVHKLIKGAAD
jgi:2'-5' RNA ligase